MYLQKLSLYTLLLIIGFSCLANKSEAKPKNIDVSAKQVSFSLIDKTQTQFDKLIYRGGIELFSENKHFGGLSGIIMSPDGNKLIAVSDRGRWFGGDVIYENGKLKGLGNMLYDRLTDETGAVLRGKNNKDSESISTWRSDKLTDGVIVAYERKEKLLAYKTRGTKIVPGAVKLPLPADIKNGPHNKELETVIRFHRGRLKNTSLVFSENHRDENNNIKGWLLSNKRSSQITLRAWGSFNVTDASVLPNGDILILERAVSPLTGLSMQIRLVKADNIKPKAVLDGPILLQASQLMMIDNMEGMALHTDSQGRLIISLISDDNFGTYQRTLLLQFELPKHFYAKGQ